MRQVPSVYRLLVAQLDNGLTLGQKKHLPLNNTGNCLFHGGHLISIAVCGLSEPKGKCDIALL